MLSKKTKYGLQALLFLAKRSPHSSVLIADLAKEEGIPQKFLESILLDLKLTIKKTKLLTLMLKIQLDLMLVLLATLDFMNI